MKKKVLKTVVWIVFTIYMIILMKLILFKYPVCIASSVNWMDFKRRLMFANYIPFKTIYFYLVGEGINEGIAKVNLLGNIIGFMPYGFLAPLLETDIKDYKKALKAGLFISLTFEVIQLITGLGSFDVDDLILNTLGTILGYAIFRFAFDKIKFLKKLGEMLE
ncbi:MAG: VanZ family protein [Clostridia bacterium]|nr:VanZ family protein [Clostridia bacterium]